MLLYCVIYSMGIVFSPCKTDYAIIFLKIFMIPIRIFLFVSLVLFCFTSYAQNTFNLKNPGEAIATKCATCLQTLKMMPPEVQMGVSISETHEVYFLITDPVWFSKLFRTSADGIAIDLVSKDQYVCGGKNKTETSWAGKGTLLEPMYLTKLKANAFTLPNGYYAVKIGEVPPILWGKEIEANVLLIQNYYLCQYKTFYQLPTFGWGLLDMGLYLNKLVFKSDKDSNKTLYQRVFQKEFKFVVPFQKGKYEYSAADVKPIFDSLNLVDYDIKSITIRAYSSIEGPKNVNIDLQQKRAQSIVNALQGYQKSTIRMDIHASENWVEFLQDIKTTKYAAFAALTKDEIKAKLTDKTIMAELEPILKKHRKAILYIELDKKNPYLNTDSEQLVKQFNASLTDKNLQRALEIQTVLYDRLRSEAAENYANRMEIPRKTEFSILLNNKGIFSFLVDMDAQAALKQFQELSRLFPNEGRFRYNICVLKFQLWLEGTLTTKPDDFKIEIYSLNKYGIPATLINRMLVNYYIIRGDQYMQLKDYINKDKCLTSIQSIYKNLIMTDDDMVSLAQYFSYYAKYDWATALLKPKINTIDVDEELLFYYINLTISDPFYTDKPEYRSIMLNAININQQRYCAAFNSIEKQGITFQLLEDDYLKKTYCENCQ